VEEFIKRSDEFLKNLRDEEDLKTYFIGANLAIFIFSAIYGATMGLYAGELQILHSAVKVPILLLISLYLSIPSYYVLYSLLGGKRTLGQTVILLLFGFTIMSTVLLALVPVNLFFIITTTRSPITYAFTVFLNILIFTLAGTFAFIYFLKGGKALYREYSENWKLAFLLGSTILMFVGTQLAWVLRPYFHYYTGFIRPLESNFYTAVIELSEQFMGRMGVIGIGIFGLIFAAWLLYSTLMPTKETELEHKNPHN
jgi:hypothetical protein